MATPAIRRMELRDITEAERLFHFAFGTFVGLPDPSSFGGDKNLVETRWHGKVGDGLVAELDGRLAASNMLARWGSFAFFGPLTTRPDLWDRGIAKALLAATMDVFDAWDVTDAGLFTFPHSTKHVGLYQKFDFWPRFLTAVMTKEPAAGPPPMTYSTVTDAQREEVLSACRDLSDSIYSGLDLSAEIESVFSQKLGDTVLVWDGNGLDGFAVCHTGAGTEGGTGACYVKFAAARDHSAFEQALLGCEAFASSNDATRMEIGVNTGCSNAYRSMLAMGYHNQFHGVAMHKPNREGYCRSDTWVLGDWR